MATHRCTRAALAGVIDDLDMARDALHDAHRLTARQSPRARKALAAMRRHQRVLVRMSGAIVALAGAVVAPCSRPDAGAR